MRSARPFLLVAALVLVLTGGVVLVSLLGQDADPVDPGLCDPRVATVDVGGVAVALDDQDRAGADPCDLLRRGPTPTIPLVGYDCRVIVPEGYDGPPLPDRIEPTHAAGTCRQGDPAAP